MFARSNKLRLRSIACAAVAVALGLPSMAGAAPPHPLALLQAGGLQSSPRHESDDSTQQERSSQDRSPQEKRADRAARALTKEQRNAARKIRLAQIALIEQLLRMPPADQQRFLRENPRMARMPAPQRQRIERLLRRLNQLPPAEQELLLERYRLFQDLPPDKQQQARRMYRQWQQIERQRRKALLGELENLRDASPRGRRQRFQSDEFREAFSPREQRILRALSGLFP